MPLCLSLRSCRYMSIPRAETVKLIRRARRRTEAGRAAQAALIEQNRGLIIAILRRYPAAGLPPHVSLDDLESEGVKGLLRAIAKFDPVRSTAFSTYTVPWIRQSIQRFLEEQADLSVSVHQVRRRKQVQRAAEALTQQHRRPPTTDELARTAGLTARQVRAVENLPYVALSLDQPPPAAQDSDLGDVVPDHRQSADLAAITRATARPRLLGLIERRLPPRAALVLRLLAGLHPAAPAGLSRNQIAAKLGLTPQHVAKIVRDSARALTADPAATAELRELLEPEIGS